MYGLAFALARSGVRVLTDYCGMTYPDAKPYGALLSSLRRITEPRDAANLDAKRCCRDAHVMSLSDIGGVCQQLGAKNPAMVISKCADCACRQGPRRPLWAHHPCQWVPMDENLVRAAPNFLLTQLGNVVPDPALMLRIGQVRNLSSRVDTADLICHAGIGH